MEMEVGLDECMNYFCHQLSYPDCWDRTVRLIRKSTWASASPHTTTISTGWPRWAAHSAEEVDVLPESQAGLLHARAQLCLQCSSWCLHSEGDWLEGHGHLRGLHLPVVSVWRFGVKVEYCHIIQVFKLTSLPSQLLHHHPLPGEMWVCQQYVPTTWLL